MYPGFIAEFEDLSDISTVQSIAEVRNKPLFAALFTSDKGVEGWNRISGDDFFTVYGKNISFSRHGQPLLQAAMTINAGAELFCKRLVASNSTLANIGIVASLTDTQIQAKNAEGLPLYKDAEGNETVEVTDTPVTVSAKSIKYIIRSATDVSNMDEAVESIKKACSDNEYLLYVITDNGRGTSKKRIKIVPNYRLSKTLSYTYYTLSILEGDVEIESLGFAADYRLIVNNQNISMQSMARNSKQIKCYELDDQIDLFVEALAEAAGLEDSSKMYSNDILFGKTNRGTDMNGIVVDITGIDLQYNYGQMLQNGSNGDFGNNPITATEAWAAAAIDALNGTYDTTIFNVDQYKITAFVDANYPKSVKRAIETLAAFREDFMYFRDQGLGKTSVELIEAECGNEAKNMFCATYPQSYDIIDPYSKRQISVTSCYDIAQLLVAHCDNGSILPAAGMKHKMTIPSAIYGTLSFSPTVCPDPEGNQKERLEELRANYASYIDNELVIESQYTSQEKYSQWSFINNVMGIQEVIKAIRTRCPAIRYTFIEGSDLEQYKNDVEEVIAPFRTNFKTLELEYKADTNYSANKIFYAVLKVVYKDFIQTEWIKVTALSSLTTVEG